METCEHCGQRFINKACITKHLKKCKKYTSPLTYKQLQSENEKLKEEIQKLKPKPLLFGFLDDFIVYIMPEVPENQIWFSTHDQLSKAIDYSIQFIEKRYEQSLKETKE